MPDAVESFGSNAQRSSRDISIPLYSFHSSLEKCFIIDAEKGISIRKITAEEKHFVYEHDEKLCNLGILCAGVAEDLEYVLSIRLNGQETPGWNAYPILTILRCIPKKTSFSDRLGILWVLDAKGEWRYRLLENNKSALCKSFCPNYNEPGFSIYRIGDHIDERFLTPLLVPDDVAFFGGTLIFDQNGSLSDIHQHHFFEEIDLDQIELLWGAYKSYDLEKNRFMETVLRRFNLGYCRTRESDRLIDYAIALEALFAHNESEAASDKLARRVALYIGETQEECSDFEVQMKSAYKFRSYLVHGETRGKFPNLDIIIKNCSVMEDFLKKSICKYFSEDAHLSHTEFIDKIEKKKYGAK